MNAHMFSGVSDIYGKCFNCFGRMLRSVLFIRCKSKYDVPRVTVGRITTVATTRESGGVTRNGDAAPRGPEQAHEPDRRELPRGAARPCGRVQRALACP